MKLKVRKEIADKLTGLNKNDFRVEHYIASGPGGQHKNKVATAVRITHRKTKISSEATDSKSQKTNKKNAFQKLIKKLVNHYEKEIFSEARNKNVEVIRSYNDKRNTVKDHRTKIELPYDSVLNGDINLFIEESIKQNA